MQLCINYLLVAVLIGLQILKYHQVSAEGDSQSCNTSDEISQVKRILKLAQTSHMIFYGTEAERLEVVDLRTEIANWEARLQEVEASDSWSTDNVESMINAAEEKTRTWMTRMWAEQPITKDANVYLKETFDPAAIETCPKVQLIVRAIRVVVQLRDVWAVATIRFSQAVASNASCNFHEKLKRVQGVVDFNPVLFS